MATANRVGLLMSALLVSGVPAQERPPTPATSAHISGRVVSADTGAPLPDVLVQLVGIRHPSAGESSGWHESRTSRSDGTFDYADVPPGDFELSASRAGFYLRSSTQIALSPRQRLPLTVTMIRGGAITGRIVDEYGEPVAQVQVEALRSSAAQDGSRRVVPSGFTDVTDDLGRFRVYGLQAGEFAVSAGRHRGSAITPRPLFSPTPLLDGPPTYYPGTLDPAMAQAIALREGQDVTVEFTLREGRLFRLSGRAAIADGTPLARATLMLQTSSILGMRPGGQTAADGSFEIADVPPGRYTIEVLQTSGGTLSCTGGTCVTFRERGSIDVDVSAEDVAGLSVVTSRGGRLSGTIVLEGKSSGGGFPIRLERVDGDGRPVVLPMLTLGKDGRFDAQNVFGRMTLVSADSNWVVKSVSLGGADVLDTGIDPQGRTITGIRVVLTDRLTTIAGRVVDGRGQPLAEHGVMLLRTDGLPVRQRDGLRTLRTGADGGFKVWGMRPGTYAAGVLEESTPVNESSLDLQDRVRRYGDRFSVAEGETVNLELEPTAGLR